MKNRILVVEDDESISKLLYINLYAAGYEVHTEGNGSDVEELLKEDSAFDLALLDIMLPGKSGTELLPICNELDIPVIFLTAKDDVVSKVEGLRGGAEDYIVKPFEVLELLVRIEKALGHRNKSLQNLECGKLTIRLNERAVYQGAEMIPLKPMEYELLLVLTRNKNMSLSRDQLLNMVWGTEYFGETRTVDVHIAQLRKKLGDSVCIRTVSKMGYRLEV